MMNVLPAKILKYPTGASKTIVVTPHYNPFFIIKDITEGIEPLYKKQYCRVVNEDNKQIIWV